MNNRKKNRKMGKVLEELRTSRKWRREDVAERVGVQPGTVFLWERGGRRPRERNRTELEKIFDTALDYDDTNNAGKKDSVVSGNRDVIDGDDNDMLPRNTILYGPPGTGKTYATARRCVHICDGDATKHSEKVVRNRYKELVAEERIEFVTFHQSYGYEEFVEGLRPDNKGGKAGAGFYLTPEDGVLKRIAKRARKLPSKPFVLVIDEINRANVSKVMGELITLLEEDKREGADHAIEVMLPYSRKPFSLPKNLHILGTMNTADRSIALLDTALRRRFMFEELAPDPSKLEKTDDGIDLPEVLRAINTRLEWFRGRDHLVGHAWFMGKRSREAVDGVMRNKIIPLIVEYFYDDWTKVQAVLGGGNHFVRKDELGSLSGVDGGAGDDRFRWTIRDEFPADAYDRLISGSELAGAKDDP